MWGRLAHHTADGVPVPMPPEKVSKSGTGPWIDWTTIHP
jgi:hypothetical protein